MPNLERARALLQEERFQAAYDLLAGDPSVKQFPDAARLLGLTCVRMKQHAEAAKYYELVCAQSRDSEDWFNLAMARLQGGDPVHGIVALEEAKKRFTKGKQKMTVPMMLFYFVGGLLDLSMWDAAKRYLQELADTYAGLGKTSDTFLYANDVPYFSWFLNAVVTAYRGSNSQKAGVDWLTALLPRVDPEGQTKIKNAIRLLSEAKPTGRR
ncbi:MAG: hypothetical protein ACM3ZC_16890 [Bacteroidota bacterium]